MVERFAAAVREDGVPVGAILALTFTEKAAGELRERLRRRLTELGEDEHARAVDAAWIGTIHGFCARVLRAQPLAAGLDPRFEVLDEPAAAAAAAAAYERALEAWARRAAPRRSTSPPRYGPGLRELVARRLRDAAHPRRTTQPRLPIPPPMRGARSGAALRRRAAPRRRAALAAAGDGKKRRRRRRAALRGVRERAARASARVPWPGDARRRRAQAAARRRSSSRACEAYRAAWDGVPRRRAPTTTRGARWSLLDDLLDRFGARVRRRPRPRAPAVDFDDLELRVRDLLADPARRARAGPSGSR